MSDVLARLQAGLADRFRVGRELGRGGMATVYVADDLRHHRRVAVKVLEPGEAAFAGSVRFRREIETVARLTHPNILPLHDSGQVDGLLYFVMPLIEGGSLRARLDRDRQLPLAEAIHIADQVAAALDYAHRSGVVHRDIKPENILLHDGAALVTDFGIATALDRPGAEPLTRTGLAIGTPQYMSPEQISGDGPVDARTDIYALGSVVFEMIAGELPFTGPTAGAVLTRKLTETPRPLDRLRPGMSDGVSRAVARAVAPRPADRFASAADFSRALHESAVVPTPGPASVLVLPFANLSADPDNEYFADGLTDELIGDLSKLGSLRVICRTSAMACKRLSTDARAIAAELGVQHVVEGSVRRAGDRLRVTAQLVDASTNACLWSDRYDGVLDDVFAIQERLARTIADALKLRLTPEDDARLNARPIKSVPAHECYLRARQQLWRWRKDAIEHAMQILSNGLKIVGDNALLYATLGLAHVQMREAGVDLGEAPIAAAEACARKAADLDPGLPEGLLLRGWIHVARARIPDAVRDFRLALDADPNNPDTVAILANCYLISGRVERARPLIDRLAAMDPLNPLVRTLRGYADVLEGRHGLAVEAYREMLEMDPENPMGRLFYGWSLALDGQSDPAIEVLGGFGADVADSIGARLGACLRDALGGRVHEDLPRLAAEFERVGALPDMFPRFLAWCYGPLGDVERTVHWLRVGADRGFINYPFLATHDGLVTRVRRAGPFQAFLADVRERWERFDA
ncbi:MAG TPA: protein kinase [Vicinamibacterales bacterium]|nr:protein kinase [Vicinamibacterales bacterium]